EFLGDAVVGLVIAEYLHQHFLDATEGEMSRMRAAVVCKEGLLKVAHLWKLKDEVTVGIGERSSLGAPKSQSVIANAVEALIGAVFLEAGLDQVRALILKAWHQMLNSMDDLILHDPKSRLQEYTQGKTWGLPIYEIKGQGPDVTLRFLAECYVNGKMLAHGRGARKKIAESEAAKVAWQVLQEEL
ncbi:MAG: ribonuclease III family protein, partial [Mariprofundaceae bacterium]